MKQATSKNTAVRIIFFFTSLALFIISIVLFCSFKTQRMADDFLQQLGITKKGANEKISNSILGGSLNLYGATNAKNILLGNRKAVVLDLLAYTKKQVSSAAFSKEYATMKNSYKPTENFATTPEKLKAEDIANAKKYVAEMEAAIKTADATLKPIFENALVDGKKNLKNAEDPANKGHVAYTKNYDGLVKSFKDDYNRQMAEWELKYPSNHLLYVKMRLQQFMDETKDVDFSAELTPKNGKKYFANPAYERKSHRWKMAFRAGKEVVEPAREFVQKWIEEIK